MSDTELMPKSEPERWLEIFAGAGRRSWSAEQKAQIIAESVTVGASVSAVARGHGLTPQQLFAWQARSASVVDRERLSFATVVVTPVPIEIEFGGAKIRVSAGSDAAMLRVMLRAVTAVV